MPETEYRLDLAVNTTCMVKKKMQTSATKLDDDTEMVTCAIGLKGIRVSREAAEELSGLPIGTWTPLFNEVGMPRERMSILLPKRELLGAGSVDHRKDSGASVAKLEVSDAIVADLRFNLDVPDDEGPTVMMSFTLVWKAEGDEVDQVRYLLGRKGCLLKIKFRTPPTQVPLAIDNRATPLADKPAGDRAAIDRKRRAAGEKPEADEPAEVSDELLASAVQWVATQQVMSVSKLQSQFKIGYNRAARILEALEAQGVVGAMNNTGGRAVIQQTKPGAGAVAELVKKIERGPAVGSKFTSEAKAHAAKHPRRDRPPAKKK